MKNVLHRFSAYLLFSLFASVSVFAQPVELIYDYETLEVGQPFVFDVAYGNEDFPVAGLVEVQFTFEYSGFEMEDFEGEVKADASSWFGAGNNGNSIVRVDNENRRLIVNFFRINGSPVDGFGEMYGGKKKGPISNIVEIFPLKSAPEIKLVDVRYTLNIAPVANIFAQAGQQTLEVSLNEGAQLIQGEIFAMDGRRVAQFDQAGSVSLPGLAGLYIVRLKTNKGIESKKVVIR
jgi:hypothetical protein